MKTETKNFILPAILKWGIYLTAFIPLVIFSQYISPFHFGKVVVFRSIIEIMAVFYLALLIHDKSYLPPFKHKIVIAFGLLVAFFGISTIASVNPYLSFWGGLERMGGWWTFLHFFVYFLIIISVFRKKEDWFNFFKVMIAVGVISAFYGFLQRTNWSFIVGSGGRDRIFGTIGNPALFAGYQILNLFMAFALAISSWTNLKQKKYFYGAAGVMFVAVLMTVVRGSILGVAVGTVLFLIFYAFKMGSKLAKKILWCLPVLLILFLIFSFSFRNTTFVKSSGFLSRMTDFSFTTVTAQTRFWTWRAGLEGWAEGSSVNNISAGKTILLGWGPENFDVPFSLRFDPKFFTGLGSETLFDRAHNMFVEILVTMGLLAFLAYVFIFIFAFRLIWKHAFREQKIDKMLGIGLISLLAAYIVHNSFIFDTSANFLVFFTILGFIVFLTNQESTERAIEVQNNRKVGISLQMMIFFLLIGAGILAWRTNVVPAEANYALTRGIVAGWNKDISGAITKYKEALAYNVPGEYDYRHKYAEYVLGLLSNAKIGDNEKALVLDAISEVQKNINENRLDYLPYLYESRLYIILGKDDPKSPYNDKALENSMAALKISPTFVRTFYEVAQAYLNKKDYPTAIKYFSQAVELNPTVGLSHWYLAITYFDEGNIKDGLAAVEDAKKVGYTFTESDLAKLIDIYVKVGDYNNVVWVYQGLVGINPSNPQYHASLAVAYSKIGKINEAVAETRKAVQLDATFEKDARTFLQSLGRSL